MSYEPTYVDCWHFVSRLLPTNSETTRTIYCMVYNALKAAEKRRLEEKRKARKEPPDEQT